MNTSLAHNILRTWSFPSNFSQDCQNCWYLQICASSCILSHFKKDWNPLFPTELLEKNTPSVSLNIRYIYQIQRSRSIYFCDTKNVILYDGLQFQEFWLYDQNVQAKKAIGKRKGKASDLASSKLLPRYLMAYPKSSNRKYL